MTLHIAVMGAGCIGGWVGARLAAGGARVTLIGRRRLVEAFDEGGIVATTLTGDRASPNAAQIAVTESLDSVQDADFVLLCVKGRDTTSAAASLAPHLHDKAVVVSLQNGVANPERIRAALPRHSVVPGMVPFNVVWTDTSPGVHLVQATSGEVVLEDVPGIAPLVAALATGGIPVQRHPDMRRVQWAKLLLNLNNAINALSGMSLRNELSDRGYRRVLAAAMNEAWTVLRAARIEPAAVGRMRPKLAPWILPLPDLLFRVLAAPMIRIDPTARSSMADDLARRRPTEVDDINGEVVRLGKQVGVPTPVNTHLVALIHAAEAAASGSPGLSASALWPEKQP
jgi:2-dehydropantoate 2-reductase